MEAYRDQYAKLFNGGKGVVVIATSVDPDTALASWAHDSSFPILFASDVGGAIGRAYGVYDPKIKLDSRVVYVIAPDGKVAYRAKPFRELSADAYTELAAAVAKAGGARGEE
jgi:thioredoxin-dependent peroxiredoxin